MTTKRLTDLAADAAPTVDDIIFSVDTGTDTEKHVTLQAIKDLITLDSVILDGSSGGQSVYGGTGPAEDLYFYSTSNLAKGHIYFGAGGYTSYDEAQRSLTLGNAYVDALPMGGVGLRIYQTIGILTGLSTAIWGIYSNQLISDTNSLNEHVAIGAYIGFGDNAAVGTAAGIYGGDIQVYKGSNVPDSTMIGWSIGLFKNPALGALPNIGLYIYSRTTGGIPGSGFSTTTGTRNGTAIHIDGTAGWTNAILYVDTDTTTNLFYVSLTGAVYTNACMAMNEMGTAPVATGNMAKLFAQDNGAGKTRLMVRFPTGATQQIAIEA